MQDKLADIIIEDLREIKHEIKEINKRISRHETRITLISAIIALITTNFQKYLHKFF